MQVVSLGLCRFGHIQLFKTKPPTLCSSSMPCLLFRIRMVLCCSAALLPCCILKIWVIRMMSTLDWSTCIASKGRRRRLHIIPLQERKLFDEKFIRLDTRRLCELTSAADSLDMKPLVDLSSRALARMIEGKTPEEIRETFHLPDDLTEEEKLEPVRNLADDPRIRLLNRLYAKKRKVSPSGKLCIHCSQMAWPCQPIIEMQEDLSCRWDGVTSFAGCLLQSLQGCWSGHFSLLSASRVTPDRRTE